jgi:hypothetical protein
MTVTDIMSAYDESVASLAMELRAFVLKQLKDCIEIPDRPAKLIGYGYGTGYKDTICTILLSKKGVKLGLFHGSQLPDPDQLLEGSGKVHRYVQISNKKDIANPALKKLVREALKAYKKRKTISSS